MNIYEKLDAEIVTLNSMYSLNEVIECINNSTRFDAADLAAAYAIDQPDVSEDSISAHLDVLTEAGGKFDMSKAFDTAIQAIQ